MNERTEQNFLDEINIHKSFYDVAIAQRNAAWKEIESLKQRIEKLMNIMKLDAEDWCEEDEKIKQQALRILPEEKVEGDTWHVPRTVELVEMITDEAVSLKNQLNAKNNS